MSFIIAAPASGSGKTTITLGLLRAFHRRGMAVRGAKSGPDYIDPQFHAAACGRACYNLDTWAMPANQIWALAGQPEFTIIEGAMGLFDGAPPEGKGATADLARLLHLPVVLVIDAAAMAQSVAPLVQGFAQFDRAVRIAGVILNKVGSPRHADMLRTALAPTGIPVLGSILRSQAISRPSRHLGLVQAGEMTDLERFIDAGADLVSDAIDLDALEQIGRSIAVPDALLPPITTPKTIAIARDAAFGFRYPHHDLADLAAGHTIVPFSPLANDPVPEADEIILPGGYPELHAATLATAERFLASLREAASSTPVYGECGGYMVLGEVLTDADGTDHKMAGLLPLHTSFAKRKLHLGYRNLTRISNGETQIKAHEFHYASTIRSEGTPLFTATDAEGHDLEPMGLIEGHVSGSFAHIIA